jgi:hypothetical protein
MELADLPADELAAVLAPLKNRDKVIVISACYSGGFIPALKDERTLIMTASRADRVSFGCSEEADFTYFGDALFAQALNQTDDLQQAFKLAATWPNANRRTTSKPPSRRSGHRRACSRTGNCCASSRPKSPAKRLNERKEPKTTKLTCNKGETPCT